MNGIAEDLRLGLRALAKNRAFAAAAVLSLALGIGANTTLFTLLDAILLRPLPVQDPASLVALYTVDSHNPGYLLSSVPNFQDYRERNPVFSSLMLYSAVTMSVTRDGEPRLTVGQLVSGDYFTALGVRMARGRGFRPDEDAAPGARPVAVISHGLWTRQFDRDPRAVGGKIEIDGRPFDIIGVAPEGFQGLDKLISTDVWTPFMMYPQVYPNVAWVTERRALAFSVVGRLKPGVSLRQAETAMNTLAANLEQRYPLENQGRRVKLVSLAEASISPRNRPAIANAGVALMTVATLVLLIACANVANLQLVRAAARTKEFAVRLAMGASRWRLVRQLLTESAMLGLAGGGAGLLLARWARDVLWAARPPMLAFAGVRLSLDPRVLFYTLGLSLATGLIFGLAPALRAATPDLAKDLKERSSQPQKSAARNTLVVGQVAFSLVALIGAGLFVRSLASALQMDPGFTPGHLGIVAFNLADQGYSQARGSGFQASVVERAAAIPGVVSAALAKDPPLHVSMARTATPEGQTGQGRFTPTSPISPGYLRTMEIPLQRGRDFGPSDGPEAPRVTIVNEAAAAAWWPDQEALGKTIRFQGDPRPAEVIGVARNANYQSIGEPPQPLIYLCAGQYYFPMAVLYIRTEGDPAATLAAARAEVQSMDRGLPLQSETVGETIREALWAPRLAAWLLAVFGGLALLLSMVGIYGVTSYSVSQRAREIGVRAALGATPGQVQLLVLREGFRLAAAGSTAGLAIALLATSSVRKLLFGVSPWDPLTFIAAPLFLLLVAMAACWLPALRATRIDPANALRDE
jgi:predicted permease